jgi:hypothetical protein
MFRSIFSRMSRVMRVSLITLAAVGLTAGSARAAAAYFSSRVYGQSTNQHYVSVGLFDNYVTIRGDGDTDLDCWLYGPNGELVSSDTDGTDFCVLRSPGLGTHRVVIRNYGYVYNDYIVRTTSR